MEISTSQGLTRLCRMYLRARPCKMVASNFLFAVPLTSGLGANNNSRRRRPARRQAVNLPVYEKQNWLLFLLFSQQDFDKCMASSRTHECHLQRVTAHCIEAMRALTHRLTRKQHICALHQRSLATSAAADGSHMHAAGLIQRSNGQVSTSLDTLQDVLRQDPSNCQVALDVARNM